MNFNIKLEFSQHQNIFDSVLNKILVGAHIQYTILQISMIMVMFQLFGKS